MIKTYLFSFLGGGIPTIVKPPAVKQVEHIEVEEGMHPSFLPTILPSFHPFFLSK